MTRNLTCIICPRGCELCVEQNGDSITVSGNSCPKGEQYAIDETTNPTRTVTTTVRVTNRENTMVSVKTAAPVPRDNIFDVMRLVRQATATAPVKIGDVILKDVFGTDIVAAKNID